MKKHLSLATVAAVAALAWPALAQEVVVDAPLRPSDLVTLGFITGGDCKPSSSFELDGLVPPDGGSKVPFVLQPDEVFIVTGLEYKMICNGGNQVIRSSLDLQTDQTQQRIFIAATMSDSGGRIGNSVLVPNVVVKPGNGVAFCFSVGCALTLAEDVLVHGFVAKDR